MSATFPHNISPFEPIARRAARARSPMASRLIYRGILLLACAAAVMAAAWLSNATPYLQADPSLAQLMRGMAVIKATMVLGAVALLLWRLRWSVSPFVAVTYVVSAALMAGSTTLIWQLSFIPLAAVLFHLGTLMALLVSWRVHGQMGSPLSRKRAAMVATRG